MKASKNYTLDEISDAISLELDHWQKENKVHRLWEGDASLWTDSDEAKWLGWLTIIEKGLKEIPSIQVIKNKIKTEGYLYIVLLGMGGSSLCPAMLATTFGDIEGNPQLLVLDSTDPMQIHHLEKKVDLKKTLFIVSSKSGSTLEPNIFKQYFYAQLQTALGKQAVGDRFIAITDPGTKLESMARAEQFMAVFSGDPSIGGRYSALSNFGLVPAELMGIDLEKFLQSAEKMRQACLASVPVKNNPGVNLGVTLGVCAKFGLDKITLVVSPDIQAFGAWLEQLLAESTGKMGKGLIPIDLEPLGKPEDYGSDRLFVYIRSEENPDIYQEAKIKILEERGHKVLRLSLATKDELAGEFFRWEMATAVAGSIIGINPFNQPDVEGSKILAAKLIKQYLETGKMQEPTKLFAADGLELFSDENNRKEMTEKLIREPSLETLIKAHLDRIRPGDYVNLSAFIEMSEPHIALLQKCRVLIRDEKKVATCLGFGPRFLHSTGQAYKGGPNTGVFLQITAEHKQDIKIPETNYSFGLVIAAQAEADFEVLAERGRRVLRIHFTGDVSVGLQKLCQLINKALTLN